MIKITKIKVKKSHRRSNEKEYFTYTYIYISFFEIVSLSICPIGLSKMDIRLQLKWGWK